MQDSWQSGDPYDYFMGRWSRLVATLFIDWLSPRSGLRWLDLGCGSGALSETILNGPTPKSVTAIDQSQGFVATARRRLGDKVDCRVGNALALPLDNAAVDMAVSGLVLNFIPEPEAALAEMRRVTAPGGTVAVYVWDYAGLMEFLNYFWDTAVDLDPDAADLHEGRRFPQSNAVALRAAFERAGFADITAVPLDIATRFDSFNDYWQPFLGGQGPAPTYTSNLADAKRDRLRDSLMERLPIRTDGSIGLSARAWAVKGLV